MIAVTFALPAESSHFRKKLREKRKQNRNGVPIVTGKIDDHEVEVLHTGVGEKACRERIAIFLQDRKFDCLISAGFAGALTNQLRPGDLLLATNYSTAKINLKNISARPGTLHTSPHLIDSAGTRAGIAAATSAIAVDMETEFIARACAEHALPMISLRAISDSPDKPFPAPPKVLFDLASQRTRAGRFAGFFVSHPHRVPGLILFARRIKRAKKNLATGLVAVIQQL